MPRSLRTSARDGFPRLEAGLGAWGRRRWVKRDQHGPKSCVGCSSRRGSSRGPSGVPLPDLVQLCSGMGAPAAGPPKPPPEPEMVQAFHLWKQPGN